MPAVADIVLFGRVLRPDDVMPGGGKVGQSTADALPAQASRDDNRGFAASSRRHPRIQGVDYYLSG